jgi:hypothetical protein
MSVPAATVPTPSDAVHAASAGTGADACAGCGRVLLGDFCHACGERRVRPDEMTLRAFARDVASEVMDLDSRAYRSLRFLLTRPGFLTVEWVAGRRRAYLGPLKLFLAAFAAVLVAGSVLSPPAAEEAAGTADETWIGGIVRALAGRTGTSTQETLERLNATALSHLSWLSLLVPVLLAALLALVFLRRRRGYVEHLVFAAHAATFNLVLGLFLLPLQPLLQSRPGLGLPLLALLTFGVMWLYLRRAVARVYGEEGWRGGVRAAVLLLGFNVAQGIVAVLAVGTATLSMLYL